MKSEKARQELDDGSWKVEVDCEGEEFDLPYHAVRVDVAQYAVELAEQEAEERIREKAAKAFKFACTDNYGGECWANDDHHVKCSGKCAKMNDFIQKLNENEND